MEQISLLLSLVANTAEKSPAFPDYICTGPRKMTRQFFLTILCTLTLVTALLAVLVAPNFLSHSLSPTAQIDEYTLETASLLPDVSIGEKHAPITIIEYLSYTCGHCANFHTKTIPHLKEKYIKTGKVRFIERDLAFNSVAIAASMLTRCKTSIKDLNLSANLLKTQNQWAFSSKPHQTLKKWASAQQFTDFEKCLSNQKLLTTLRKDRIKASKELGVIATPTLFINGAKYQGFLTPKQIDQILEPLLKDEKKIEKLL